jgi:hypothetical protein
MDGGFASCTVRKGPKEQLSNRQAKEQNRDDQLPVVRVLDNQIAAHLGQRWEHGING